MVSKVGTAALSFCSEARTASHRRGAGVIKSPSKAPVITQEIDSEIEKVCGHEDSPSPTSSTPRFSLCDRKCGDGSALPDT